jgi:hypothetical protein
MYWPVTTTGGDLIEPPLRVDLASEVPGVLPAGVVAVLEVTAPAAGTLDAMWRQRWADAGRAAKAPWCSAGPAFASVRVNTDRAAPLLALANELAA